jgi:hypothetical protein
MSLGRLVQNVVGSPYLVAEPWTMSRLCGRFKFRKYLGPPSYLIYHNQFLQPTSEQIPRVIITDCILSFNNDHVNVLFYQFYRKCSFNNFVILTKYKASNVCPTRYRTRHFFNNSNTNEDIATKFEQGYVHCMRNEEEYVCSAPNILISGKIIKEIVNIKCIWTSNTTNLCLTFIYILHLLSLTTQRGWQTSRLLKKCRVR